MSYRFKATERFWHSFYDLSSAQKNSVRRACTNRSRAAPGDKATNSCHGVKAGREREGDSL
jgi:hypothetical protein